MNKLIKYFVEATGYRRIFLLAVLAVISALLAQFAGIDPWQIMRVPSFHGSDLSPPILPGIYFGTVLAVGAYTWKRNSLFTAGIILVGTAIAWIAACECAVLTFSYLYHLYPTIDSSPIPRSPPIAFLIIAGVAGGFVGGDCHARWNLCCDPRF